MSESDPDKPRPSMAEPARYQIRIRGHVDPVVARRLRGLDVENGVDGTGAPMASLRGELPDQAALMGVLHTLNDYQLPLLSAEFQSPREDTGASTNGWQPLSLPGGESS